jgi:polar amino acid transport system substrate-binding protein
MKKSLYSKSHKAWKLSSLILLLVSLNTFSAEKLLIAGDNLPPYLDKFTEGRGWAWQITELALKQAKLDYQFEFIPWARVIVSAPELINWNAAFPAYYSEERAQKFLYSAPIIQTKLGFFKLKKNTHIKFDGSFESVKHYRIGNCRKCAVRADFDNDETLNKVIVNNLDGGIQMLFRERIDLLVGNYHVNSVKMEAMLQPGNPYGLTRGDIEFIEPTIQIKPVYLAVSKKLKGHEKIVFQFNQALTEVNNLPEVQAILQLNENH